MEFQFACTLCGDCCTGNQTVRLNGQDLELIRQHQGLPDLTAVFSSGLVEPFLDENGFYRPRIRFRRRPFRFCPFLVNQMTDQGQVQGLCSLHPQFKPLVCHLAPLSRTVELPSGDETWQVVPPVEGCPGLGRGQVRSRIEALVGLEDRLAEEKAWFQAQAELTDQLRDPVTAVRLWARAQVCLDSRPGVADN